MAQSRFLEHEQVDPRWVTPVCIITMLGLAVAYSASYPMVRMGDGGLKPDASYYFKLQAIFAVVGCILAWGISFAPPGFLRKIALPLLLGAFGFMVVAVVQGMLGGGTRGQSNWVDIGPVRFQPSEFAKLAYLGYLASLFSIAPLRGKYLKRVAGPLGLCFGAFALLLFLQRDLGSMIMVILITVCMCFLGGMSLKILLPSFGGLIALGLIYGLTNDGAHGERLRAFLNPFADPANAGYHTLTMLVGIAQGGLFGQGLGDSEDKWGQMPEAHNDAIFCVLGGELGFLRSAIFLVLMASIVVRAMQIGRMSGSAFGYMLCCGVGAMFGTQALINLAVTLRLMPVTGLTLPFVSYGGSSLISCLIAAGLVMAVYRHRVLPREAAR